MNLRFFHICILLKILVLAPIFALAQNIDSSIVIPNGKTHYLFLQGLNHSPDVLMPADTGLTGVHRNFNSGYLHNLGNLGSPAFPLVWEMPRVTGFRFGFHQWDFLRLTSYNIPYFNTQNPFSELRYVQGPEKFQIINALHTQNILPNWNVGFQLKREGSEGYYNEQNSRNGNLGLNTWYRSPNRRYLVAASGVVNSFNMQENGGLENTVLFEDSALSNRQRVTLPARLSQAHQTFNDKEFNIQQFLYFGAQEMRRVATDSDSVSITILKPRFYVMHQANYYTQKYFFKDTIVSRNFYPETLDTLVTIDSYSFNNLSNKAGVGYTFSDSAHTRNYSLQGYLRYDIIRTHLNHLNGSHNNMSIGFNGRKDGKLSLDFAGEVVLNGYNGGDFFVDGSATTRFLPALRMSDLTFFGRIQNYSPTYIERRFISNNFNWLNNFTQTQSISAGGYIWDSATALKLGASYTAVSNLVYWGTDARPHRASTDMQYMQFQVARNFVIGDFHFNHELVYQTQLQGSYIRIPDFVARTSYFYQDRVARNVLLLQTGFDFSYNSSYRGYNYMPGISKFYLQDSAEIGNYPVFDVWIAGQVKRFNIFFKVEHVTQGLFGYRYYTAVNYPMQPRTFRFGLQWRFHN